MASERPSLELEAYKATVEAAKQEILAHIPKAEPLGWKLLVVVLPVILTSILGAIVFKVQSNITTRLSLTQDYYRRRLEVYGSIYENLAKVRKQASNALTKPTTAAGLDDTITAFGDAYAANTIFLTQDLLRAANDMWRDSSRGLGDPVITPEFVKAVRDDADRVEQQMRKDLAVE